MGATGQPEVRVLGGLEIDIDGVALRLDGPRRRALVALLAAQRGTPRTADWIATHLWSDHDRPTDATMTVRVYVSRLRRMSPALIVTEANGYAFASNAVLDTDLVARLHDEATGHCRAGRPAEAIASLRSALAVWRGRSFHEFADLDLLAAAGSAWDRRRADIAVVLADLVDVVDGGHLRREVAAALHTVVSDDPLREDVVLRLAVLQARLGAHTAALQTLDRLAGDIGGLTDDGIDLREAIVADDLPPVLTWQRYIRDLVGTPPTAPPATAASRWGRPARPRIDRQLLGRARELAAVQQCVGESQHGLRLVLVVGPAGIGKSEFIAHVAAQHPDVRWAAGQHEPDLPVPLLGLRRAFPALLDALPSIDDARPQPTDGSGSTVVIDAAADAIAATVDGAPTALILEDLHDADSITLHVLRRLLHAAREAPLFVIASVREAGRTLPAIRALADKARRGGQLLEVSLSGLGLDDCAEILTAANPALMTCAPAVLEATAGNPFLTHLLADSLATTTDAEVASVSGAISSVTLAVGDLMEPQLQRLTAVERDTLEIAAAVGRRAPMALIRTASPHTAAATSAAAGRLQQSRLLLDDPAGGEALLFPHELSREYVAAATPPAARRATHRRIALAMESSPELAASPRQIAAHWADSDEGWRCVPHYVAATTEALAVGAYAEALSAADDGLVWCTAEQPAFAYELHHAATAALIGLGHLSAADDRASTALAWARLTGDEAAVTHAVARTGGAYLPNAYDSAPSEVVTQVLRDVHEPLHRSLLLSQLVLLERSADQRCTAWASEAMELAEACDDVPAQLSAAHAGLTLRYGTPVAGERLTDALHYAELAAEHERPTERFTLMLDAIGAATELGEFDLATALVTQCSTDRVLRPLDRWWLLSHQSTLAAASGDLDEAERLAREGRALGDELGVADAAAWYFAQLWSLNRQRGRAGELVKVFTRQTVGVHASWRAMAAAELAATDDARGASEVLDGLSAEVLTLPPNYLHLGTLAVTLIAADAAGHPLAAACRERLTPFQRMHAIYGAGCAYVAPVDQLLR